MEVDQIEDQVTRLFIQIQNIFSAMPDAKVPSDDKCNKGSAAPQTVNLHLLPAHLSVFPRHSRLAAAAAKSEMHFKTAFSLVYFHPVMFCIVNESAKMGEDESREKLFTLFTQFAPLIAGL